MVGKSLRDGDLPLPASVDLKGHAILRQGFGLVFDRQRLVPQADRDPGAGKTPFPIQPPMAEAHGAADGEQARGAQAEEAVEVGGIVLGTLHPPQHRGGTDPPIAAKRAAFCRRVRLATPVSRARALAGCPKSTIGRSSW